MELEMRFSVPSVTHTITKELVCFLFGWLVGCLVEKIV